MFIINEIYNDTLKASNLLVMGDIIYDNYLFCNTTRISPETQVPIIKPFNEEFRLGGAANVFHNMISLGAKAQLCGSIGNDKEGNIIRSKINELNNLSNLIFISNEKTTTKKTRLIVDNHHLLRIDEELISEVNEQIEHNVFAAINGKIDSYDLLIVSDYNKGFLKYSLIRKVVDLFIERNKKVIVDPKSNFYKYSGAFLIKPNIRELAKFVGDNNIHNDRITLIRHCRNILVNGNFEYIYVTMGAKGGVLVGRDGCDQMIPAVGDKAADITGAGDTTLAAIAIAVVANVNIVKTVQFASLAAGISVSKVGTSTVTKSEITSFVKDNNI